MPGITCPGTVFQYFVAETSRQILGEQLDRDVDSIFNALRPMKLDTEVLRTKLYQLRVMKRELNFGCVADGYKRCQDQLRATLNALLRQLEDKCQLVTQKSTSSLEHDSRTFLQLSYLLTQLEPIRREHEIQIGPLREEVERLVQFAQVKWLTYVTECLSTGAEHAAGEGTDILMLISQQCNEIFGETAAVSQLGCQQVSCCHQQLKDYSAGVVAKAIASTNQGQVDFILFTKTMNSLASISQRWVHILGESLSAQHKTVSEAMTKVLRDCFQVSFQPINHETVKMITASMRVVDAAFRTVNLELYLNMQEIKQLQANFFRDFQASMQNEVEHVQPRLKSISGLCQADNLFSFLKSLWHISPLRVYLSKLIDKLQAELIRVVTELRENGSKALLQLVHAESRSLTCSELLLNSLELLRVLDPCHWQPDVPFARLADDCKMWLADLSRKMLCGRTINVHNLSTSLEYCFRFCQLAKVCEQAGVQVSTQEFTVYVESIQVELSSFRKLAFKSGLDQWWIALEFLVICQNHGRGFLPNLQLVIRQTLRRFVPVQRRITTFVNQYLEIVTKRLQNPTGQLRKSCKFAERAFVYLIQLDRFCKVPLQKQPLEFRECFTDADHTFRLWCDPHTGKLVQAISEAQLQIKMYQPPQLKIYLRLLHSLTPFDKFLGRNCGFEKLKLQVEGCLKDPGLNALDQVALAKSSLNFKHLTRVFTELQNSGDQTKLSASIKEISEWLKREHELLRNQPNTDSLESICDRGERGQKLQSADILTPFLLPAFAKRYFSALKKTQHSITEAALSHFKRSVRISLTKLDFQAAETARRSMGLLESFVDDNSMRAIAAWSEEEIGKTLETLLKSYFTQCSFIQTNDLKWTNLNRVTDAILIRYDPASRTQLGGVFYYQVSLDLKIRLPVDVKHFDSALTQLTLRSPGVLLDNELTKLAIGCRPVLLNFSVLSAKPSAAEICRQLNAVTGDRHEYYRDRATLFSAFVSTQCHSYLELLRLCEPSVALEQLVKLQEYQHQLPGFDVVQEPFDLLRRSCVENEQSWAKETQEEIETEILERKMAEMDGLVRKGWVHRASHCKITCDSIITSCITEFRNQAMHGALEAVTRVAQAQSSWAAYVKLLERLKTWIPDHHHFFVDLISTECSGLLNDLAQRLTESFSLLPSTTDHLLRVNDEVLVIHFRYLKAVLDLKTENPNFFEVKEMISLSTKAVSTIVGCYSWFAGVVDRYQSSLRSREVLSLRESLEASRCTQLLLRCILEASQLIDPFIHPNSFQLIRSYVTLRGELSEAVLKWQELVLVPLQTNPRLMTPNASDRDEYIRQLSLDMQVVQRLVQLRPHVNLKGDAGKDCSEFLEAELAEKFNFNYDSLRACRDLLIPALASISRLHMEEIDHKISHLIAKRRTVFNTPNIPERTYVLVSLKAMGVYLPAFRCKLDEAINDSLLKLARVSGGSKVVRGIGHHLHQKIDTGLKDIAQMLIAEHPSFQGYAVYLRNERTRSITLEHILADVHGDHTNTHELEKHVKCFTSEYWSLVTHAMTHPATLTIQKDKLLCRTRALAGANAFPSLEIVKSLVAHVFAYWTLAHSDHYMTPGSVESTNRDEEFYLLQPHAAQVVSIFRLLGFDNPLGKGEKGLISAPHLENHLVQIKTGEGKSIVLAVTATVLALLGFTVDCACYSDYLSGRDKNEFVNLFDAFGVNEHINYGSFNSLLEALINVRGDVRSLFGQIMNGKPGGPSPTSKEVRPRVLLIDEVDVFFSKDFYGNLYRPVACVKDPAVTKLIKYLWRTRDQRLPFSKVRKLSEYAVVRNQFSDWEVLITESVRRMIEDLRTYESHDYVIHNGRIAYKDQDRLSFDIQYGYKTLFAYFKETDAGKIHKDTLEEMISLKIDCGNFSYAEIPKKYQHVLGVTGTLNTLNERECKLLVDDYKITKYTYIPSIYGENRFRFAGNTQDDVKVEEGRTFYETIYREIIHRLNAGSRPKARAVLVVFESTKKS